MTDQQKEMAELIASKSETIADGFGKLGRRLLIPEIQKEVLLDLWIEGRLFTEEQDEVIENEIQKRLQGEK
jgi:hypothetical protein